ncbi:MAG: hypothetical protein PHZ11_02220 [Desulfitobacteriaceae bacterium]|nr:hypothetical protein [Desulfitobacteriaceae bacterium]MDD4345711.1 hypothetical protein [Desulfitobacteriaceae bacterium]MDD4401361.1 hypothetical protein [Desulfitobacteriaceae bacterium]
MAHGSFGTAINCMDGRTQLPVNEYLRNRYNLDFIDTVTEPGPVKILAENQAGVESIRQRVKISVEGHGSKLIAIIAHYDCAGNPVSKEIQLQQLDAAIKIVRSWNYEVEYIGLWVDDKWQVEQIQ